MNLQTQICAKLWLSIQSTYQNKNYNHAILDAMHYLSDVLREKSGLDGDGISLIGQTFGGASPHLKINNFQTETEKDEQRGMESILRGLYQAVRNPRSHEQIEDTKETADSIICFIDYLLNIIDKSKEPFDLSIFLDRIFDKNYFNNQHYTDLLINEIPKSKLLDVAIAIYRKKTEGEIKNIRLLFRTLINNLNDNQREQFFLIVSEELKIVTSFDDIRFNFKIMPPKFWTDLAEVSRLRIENIIIQNISEGSYYDGKCKEGGLATWAREFFQFFTLKRELEDAFLHKILSGYSMDIHYVSELFIYQLPLIIIDERNIKKCVHTFSNKIRNDDEIIRKSVVDSISTLDIEWQRRFVEDLKDITDKEFPEIHLPDGTPFLTFQMNDEDIPF